MIKQDYTPEVKEMTRILDYDLFRGHDPFSIDGNASQYYYILREQHGEQLADQTWYTAYGIFKANNPDWYAHNMEEANA